ncbi:unnamed protein product [Chrysoparadoxa australica]
MSQPVYPKRSTAHVRSATISAKPSSTPLAEGASSYEHDRAFKATSMSAIKDLGCVVINTVVGAPGSGKVAFDNALALIARDRCIEEAGLTDDQDFAAFLEACTKQGFFDGLLASTPEWEAKFMRIVKVFLRTPHERLAEKMKLQALRCMGVQDFCRAHAFYTKAIQLSPASSRSHVYYASRAALHCKMDQFEDAIEDCVAAIALKEDYAKAHNFMGYALMHSGRLEEAVPSFHAAVQLRPNDMSCMAVLRHARMHMEASLQARERAKEVAKEAATLAARKRLAAASYQKHVESMKASKEKEEEVLQEKDQARLSKAAKMLGVDGAGSVRSQLLVERNARAQLEAAMKKMQEADLKFKEIEEREQAKLSKAAKMLGADDVGSIRQTLAAEKMATQLGRTTLEEKSGRKAISISWGRRLRSPKQSLAVPKRCSSFKLPSSELIRPVTMMQAREW